ncbi:MAG TPA: SDR family NAD(P)-dependent oxidoreductase [Steroidobacteraceae bacterium]|nr:SDR family NAD(P)-dependent oxidoreductase [Steroidobacteraceae bacterium]
MKLANGFFGVAAATLSMLGAGAVEADTVLITGSNQGIGLALAKGYAAKGWTVIATHRRDTTPDALAELAKKYPGKVRAEKMDVTDDAQIKALATRMKGQPIDVLLNNAALIRYAPVDDQTPTGGNAGQLFGTLDYKQLDEFVHTNVAGPLKITEAFIENVRASKQKKIIAISSAAGSLTRHPLGANHYWYYITKAAENQAMHMLSVQFEKEPITVAMFHPGGVQVESFGDIKLPGFISPEAAAEKLINTIGGLTKKDSGRFMENDGTDHPW